MRAKRSFLCFVLIALPSMLLAQIDWYEEFNSEYPHGISFTSAIPWGESYIIRGLLSMYRASVARGEPIDTSLKYLTWAQQHCSYVIDSCHYTGEPYLVWTGHIFATIADFIKIVLSDSFLYSRFGAQASRFLYYIEDTIVPIWRYSEYWKTPHNWYLAYGLMLLRLVEISRTPYYMPPYYRTPDTSLVTYYRNTVHEMAETYFTYRGWIHSGTNWSDAPFPAYRGLCYCPALNAYAWRYCDYMATADLWGFDSSGAYCAIETDVIDKLGYWYKFEVSLEDSLRLIIYDSTGTRILFRQSVGKAISGTDADFVIGKRPDGSSFFVGALDELVITRGHDTLVYLRFEGDFADLSRHGRDGVSHGTPSFATGKVGQAVVLDGDDYITIPHDTALNDNIKISFWIRFDELASRRYYVMGKGNHFHYDRGGYHLSMSCFKRAEDVGHANIDIEFVVAVANDPEFASAYPDSMLQRFCNTFTKIVWTNTDTSNPTFRSHVNPDGGVLDYVEHTMRWLWLYQYDSLIGILISNWYESRPSLWGAEVLGNLACWQNHVTISSRISSEPNYQTQQEPALGTLILTGMDNLPLPKNTTSIRIFDIKGRIVFSKRTDKINGRDHIDISSVGLSQGVYILHCKTKTKPVVRKLIVVR